MRRHIFFSATALAALASLSCSDSTGASRTAVASVLIAPDSGTVIVGNTMPLTATVRDANGNVLSGRSIFWATDNSALATVDANGVLSALAPGTVQVAASSEGQYALATFTIVAKTASYVTISPSSATLQVRGTTQLSATPFDASGAALVGRSMKWTSSAPRVASVDTTGLVSGIAPGNAVITVTVDGKSASAAITVNPIPVGSVVITTPPSHLIVGQQQQLIVTVRDATGAIVTNPAVSWTASGAALVVSSTGMVTGLAPGSATVIATSQTKSDTVTITVDPVPAAAVVVSPSSASLIVGQSVGLSATVTDANGQPLSGRAVSWSSSAPAVATVSPSGTVTAVAPGTATITATSGGISGTASITVSPVPVASVDVTPAGATLTLGTSVTLTATPRDAAGHALTGRTVDWTSSNTGVATVSSSGVVTAVGLGSAIIFATVDGKTGSAAITTQPVPIASVTVSPSTASVPSGQVVFLTATVTDSAGNQITNATVDWSSDNSNVAAVSPQGAVLGLLPGQATITATFGGKSGTAVITVTAPVVASVSVAPPTLTLNVGQQGTFTATAYDSGGQPISGVAVTWTTSDSTIATVDATGTVTGVAPGTATITASAGGQSGTGQVTVQ